MSNLRYLPDSGLKAAVEMAIEMEIPLFLTGEPGTGKTELAYWIAQNGDYLKKYKLHPDLLRFNVKTSSVAKDLLYRYDAIRHFRDSHRQDHAGARGEVNVLNYISFEALGKAIISSGKEKRRVVLIDEIDKAPRDFPNDLLFEFEKLSFKIEEATEKDYSDPHFDWKNQPSIKDLGLKKSPVDEQGFIWYAEKEEREKDRRHRKVKKPILILTSNSEKSLPDAFLRRCAFYHIPFPEDRQRLIEILTAKGLYDSAKNADLVAGAVEFFLKLRQTGGLRRKPATAEMIAWVEFLRNLGINPAVELSKSDRTKVENTLSLLAKNKEDLDRAKSQLNSKT